MSRVIPLRSDREHLELLDQTLLPGEERWLVCAEPEQVADAIRRLAVRGAPAIGVAAAWALANAVRGLAGTRARERAREVAAMLAATRPTAVNLAWALGEVGAAIDGAADDRIAAAAHDRARAIECADVAANQAMAGHGAELLPPRGRVLTHCNAGALATSAIGTALGVIAEAHRRGQVEEVWVDETRPLLQGARLTAWELERLGVPHRVVTDSSVGALMSRGLVDAVVVGADRIAANGDVANKIGTYTVAVLAARHGVPFYVAAPTSTIDLATPSGAQIPIEERAESEVLELRGVRLAPGASRALNLAFDVTPAELIAAIVTEAGVARPPTAASLAALVAKGAARGAVAEPAP